MEKMSTGSVLQLSFANRALDYGPVSPARYKCIFIFQAFSWCFAIQRNTTQCWVKSL